MALGGIGVEVRGNGIVDSMCTHCGIIRIGCKGLGDIPVVSLQNVANLDDEYQWDAENHFLNDAVPVAKDLSIASTPTTETGARFAWSDPVKEPFTHITVVSLAELLANMNLLAPLDAFKLEVLDAQPGATFQSHSGDAEIRDGTFHCARGSFTTWRDLCNMIQPSLNTQMSEATKTRSFCTHK
jgi:hypothetical protein